MTRRRHGRMWKKMRWEKWWRERLSDAYATSLAVAHDTLSSTERRLDDRDAAEASSNIVGPVEVYSAGQRLDAAAPRAAEPSGNIRRPQPVPPVLASTK